MAATRLSDEELAKVRRLIEAQEITLTEAAANSGLAGELDVQYRAQHRELRALLAREGMSCFCPWDSIHQWIWQPHLDLDGELSGMRKPMAALLIQTVSPTWNLVVYRKDGDPDDLPFVEEFVLSLDDEKLGVLCDSREHELAAEGPGVSRQKSRGHEYPCGGGGRPRQTVPMFKIEEGASSSRVVLRVFYDTAPGHTIALLHGYDKGRHDGDLREASEAKEACDRRQDFQKQIANPKTLPGAVGTPWKRLT